MKQADLIRLKIGILSVFLIGCSQSLWAQKRPNRVYDMMKHQDVLYLTPEQEKETLEYLRKNYQDRLDELMELKKKRKLLYARKMSQAYREMRFMHDLKYQDEERYKRVTEEKKLEKEIREMVEAYWQSNDETQKTELRQSIRTLLNKIFDYRQMNRQDEIKKLEEKLNELKEVNEQRLANKDEIVENRLNELLGEKSELEW